MVLAGSIVPKIAFGRFESFCANRLRSIRLFASKRLRAMIDKLAIETFDVQYVPNPNTKSKSGSTSFKTFWNVRDQVLSASQRHGATGPEDGHTPTPDYWLVEDQFNDDLYQIMEVYKPSAFNREWLADIVAVLKNNRGWAVALGLGDCSILIFKDRLMVPSDKFGKCDSVEAVLAEAKKRIKRKKDSH